MPGQPSSFAPPSGRLFSLVKNSDPLARENETSEFHSRLRTILSADEKSPSERLPAILQLGADQLDVEAGYLAEIDPAAATHTIAELNTPHPHIAQDDVTDLSATHCRIVLAEGRALAIQNASEQGWTGDSADDEFGVSTYFGAKVVVKKELYGTVCFVDRAPRTEPFDEEDAAALSLIVLGRLPKCIPWSCLRAWPSWARRQGSPYKCTSRSKSTSASSGASGGPSWRICRRRS